MRFHDTNAPNLKMDCGHIIFIIVSYTDNFSEKDENTGLDLHVLCLKTLLMDYKKLRMI